MQLIVAHPLRGCKILFLFKLNKNYPKFHDKTCIQASFYKSTFIRISFFLLVDKIYEIEVKTPPHEEWEKASFIKMFYEIDNKSFVITTEMQVLP